MLKPGEEKIIATCVAEILRAVVVALPNCLQGVPIRAGAGVVNGSYLLWFDEIEASGRVPQRQKVFRRSVNWQRWLKRLGLWLC